MKYKLLFSIILISITSGKAQAPERYTSGEIFAKIQKLNVLGSAMYLAAHPDDENTTMISYLANARHINTAYLSLTRGDGGQNLIGPELKELLGVIRTQELLAARRIDNGQQFFSRANDFGYSKSPLETFDIWNKEAVLSDIVWTIRKFKPDIIINRFNHDLESRTHGHHTASAVLSYEAFEKYNDPKVFPEQLQYVEPWQPSRLFFNTSWWFYGSREKFEEADKSDMVNFDVGTYFPMIGKSNTEISAESRSQHKCQGMGRFGTRGASEEYLQLLKGEKLINNKDPFEGINITWTRIKGGAPIGEILAGVEKNFKPTNPVASIPELLNAFSQLKKLPEGHWRNLKLEELKEVISACLGFFTEATTNDNIFTPGDELSVNIEMINRSTANVLLQNIKFHPSGNLDTIFNTLLMPNKDLTYTTKFSIPKDMDYTNPYWLNDESTFGMYKVTDQLMRGLPESNRSILMEYTLIVEGVSINYITDVVFKKRDPVKAEVYKPVELIPPVSADIIDEVFVFGDSNAKPVTVLVKALKENLSGSVSLQVPKGWKVMPERVEFNLVLKGAEQAIEFSVSPPERQDEAKIKAAVTVNGKSYDQSMYVIDYDHIPTQTVLQKANAKVVKIDLKKAGSKIAYIMGAGDAIPACLEQIGYEVDILEDHEIKSNVLRNYDALILGIRAYNTVDRLKFHKETFMNYIKEGGNMIVQYNTSRGINGADIAPYPLKLSRDRVSVEEAEVRILAKEHPVINFPNKISAKDFEGWIQERGLYFPNEWDEKYTPILSSNDPGETPKDGGLLVAEYGEGHYIYTGYSWFRELPAGVPGAYRLFTNLISIGKDTRP